MRLLSRTLLHFSAVMALFSFVLVASNFTASAGGTRALKIARAGGGTVTFQVEIAATQAERERGLMERKTLDESAGMLFDFGTTRMVSMWMHDTPLPLDMLFIDKDGSIRTIAENTEPYSDTIIPSGEPVAYVLEINGGAAKRAGVTIGDKVLSGLR
ncbi:DUF192 domain-containing protein [Rhizobium sp. NRK18]|uniref:DUF192 domain-containing protein n=1 Tax=Rhizobium sp. NRK18 TaxID=2964667 RepID=UPI0021C34BC3|nr:DUF192 domain-containing protein [Rhizobium sp. NRK18]MCQ2004144.1 DUF192 domain-containing protein [Rhizobium sp. NRK18]